MGDAMPHLTADQIESFKANGYLLLPNALDPQACARACDSMWEELAQAVPRMKRDDPSTWQPFTDGEVRSKRRDELRFNNSHEGGDPRLDLSDGRFQLHNGCDPEAIETFVRPLLPIAEQLLGAGEVSVPGGLDEHGLATGPVFADGLSEATRAIHTASEPRWPVPNRTEVVSFDPSAGCVSTLNGQGTRGLYVALPESPPAPGAPPAESGAQSQWDGHAGTHTKAGGPPTGLHSDVGLSFPGRVMLRAVAFVADCPPGSGGFTLWPRTHVPVWSQLWSSVHAANRCNPEQRQQEWEAGLRDGLSFRRRVERWTGIGNTLVPELLDYHDVDGRRTRDTEAVELYGPAGTVALWHAGISHSTTTNFCSDAMWVMTVLDFHKTPESLPDEVLRARFASENGPAPGIWDDWADCVRHNAAASAAGEGGGEQSKL
jgi:hypothetical protein